MWKRFINRSQRTFTTSYALQRPLINQYSRRFYQRPIAVPITIGFLGWLFPSNVDYDAVRKEIADLLDDYDYDDGSWGPVLIRLAWHASGTYQKSDNSGGADGASMRFHPECEDGANAGLEFARDKLEQIKAKYPGISYADLWVLASYVAIQEMGGPVIDFKSGRKDADSGKACPPVGRLPDAALGAQHVRDVFYRMGFNDEEIVALVGGGHAIGRCHSSRSGFDGPWTRSPTTVSNEFFRVLFDDEWVKKKWSGPEQFVDKKSGKIMMLPTDLAIRSDPEFRKYAQTYYKDEEKFLKDFGKAFKKLTELGFA